MEPNNEPACNVSNMRRQLERCHTLLGIIIRDSLIPDLEVEEFNISDLADDVWDALHNNPPNNCVVETSNNQEDRVSNCDDAEHDSQKPMPIWRYTVEVTHHGSYDKIELDASSDEEALDIAMNRCNDGYGVIQCSILKRRLRHARS